jgi:hypothetical protein
MLKLTIVAAVATIASMTAATALAAVAPQGPARGVTTVTLDQGTIGTVVDLGLTPAAVTPAVLGMDGADLQAAFPIVGNSKGGVIKHSGGLTFTDGDTVLSLTNYRIDTNDFVLTAIAAVDGQEVGRITLFELGDAPSQAGCTATASLSLGSVAAGALTDVFGAPDLTGANFGTACVAPRT